MIYLLKEKILKYQYIFLSLLFVPVLLFGAEPVNLDGPTLLPKAQIYIINEYEDIPLNSNFDVPIYINTQGKSINTIQVDISFDPGKVSIVRPSGGESIFGIWFEAPTYNNQNGTANITGIIPNGINTTAGLITTVTFKAISLGDTDINLTDYSSANLNDGIGSSVILTRNGSSYNIIAQEEEPFCVLHPTDPTCITPTFCELNPTDPTCITPTFCELNPNDPACVVTPFCVLHPTDPTCITPTFCELNPTDPTCITPTFCELNPNDPACVVTPFCVLHPTDPTCITPTFCELNPNSPSCQIVDFCTLSPNDPSCITQPFCTLYPEDPSCITIPPEENTVEEVVTQVTDVIVNVTEETVQKTAEVLATPEGKTVSKVVTTTGAITGASISIATVMFANPLTFWELFLIPLRLWSLILIAFGLKKRNLPWGTVYDSVTKQPLDPAYVVLQDLQGNEVATSITDLDGRYGFLVPAGQYKMIANKTNYVFPSKKLLGKREDELYKELYFSEIIDVPEGGVITKNIPMDPLKFDWNEFAKKDKRLMRFFSHRDVWISRISETLFFLGFFIAIAAAVTSPVFYNIAIIFVYFILFILKRTILKPRAFGYIKQRDTKNPLSFAIVRVFSEGSDREVVHKVTDKTGKYYCLVPNGKYYTKIESKNIDESYSLVNTSNSIDVKNGYINKKFEV